MRDRERKEQSEGGLKEEGAKEEYLMSHSGREEQSEGGLKEGRRMK